jgi:uncharacterized protein with von Willebrand factor type A (vWA) domain
MTTIGGLPAHILLVHAVVGLVPATAVLLVLVAVWPAAQRRLTWPAAALAVVTLICVPVTTEAGEWLEHRVERTALLRAHTELGDTMLPWAIGLAVVALAFLARRLLAERAVRRGAAVAATGGPGTARVAPADGEAIRAAGPGGRVLSLVLAVLAVVVAVGSVVTVYRIGDSGAAAVWTGRFSEQAQPRPAGLPPGD